jgi:ribosomal 50S subunit-recycling heat shock protein
MRIDKYLKISRLIKRRTVAHEACLQERILLNGRPAKPGAEVKPEDRIEICFGNSRLRVKVLSVPEHATKEQADQIYEILTD